MPAPNKEIRAILKVLLETCRDGEQGYKNAADDVKDDEIEKILLKYSRQRNEFTRELEKIITGMGGEVEFAGSILGVLHRRWMDVIFAVAGSDAESILNECLRGENAAINKYEEHLNKDLPGDIKKIVVTQYNEIKAAYEEIKGLKESLLIGSYKSHKT